MAMRTSSYTRQSLKLSKKKSEQALEEDDRELAAHQEEEEEDVMPSAPSGKAGTMQSAMDEDAKLRAESVLTGWSAGGSQAALAAEGADTDLKDLVKVQYRKRRRRASLDMAAMPEQVAALENAKLVAEVPVETRLPTAGQDAAAAEREAAELAAKADRWSEKRQSKVGAVAPPNCHNCVIHPLSKLRRRWDFLLFVLLIYCAIIIPFRVGFENEAAGFWLIVETTIDGIFILDIFVRFRMGFTIDSEHLDSRIEMGPSKIARNYFKSWFVIDVLSAVPSQLVIFLFVEEDSSPNASMNKLPRLLRIPRLVRMIRLMKLLRMVRFFRAESQGILRSLVASIGLPPGSMRAVRLILLTVFTAHAAACSWFFCHSIAARMLPEEGQDYAYSWWDKYCGRQDWAGDMGLNVTQLTFSEAELAAEGYVQPADCEDTGMQYAVSLYWSVTTLTTMGYGEISSQQEHEFMFSIIIMLMGVSVYAYIASNISIVLTSLDEDKHERREDLMRLNHFMKHKRLTQPLRRRLRKFFNDFHKERGRFGLLSDREIVKEINIPALRNDLTVELFREIVRQVPFLHDKDPLFIEMIAPHMTLVKVGKNEYVVTEGERGSNLYFVLEGVVHCEYETDDGEKHVLMKYSDGQYFGDVAMFVLEKNIVSYRAAGLTDQGGYQYGGEQVELYMLPRPVLMDSVLKSANHADVKREMASLASEKMRLLGAQIAKIEKFKCVPPSKTPPHLALWLAVCIVPERLVPWAHSGIGGLAAQGLGGQNDRAAHCPDVLP